MLLRHAGRAFFTVGGLMQIVRIRIGICFAVALIYLLSPLDIIPEALFGIIGFLDDVFIILLFAIYVAIIYRRYVTGSD